MSWDGSNTSFSSIDLLVVRPPRLQILYVPGPSCNSSPLPKIRSISSSVSLSRPLRSMKLPTKVLSRGRATSMSLLALELFFLVFGVVVLDEVVHLVSLAAVAGAPVGPLVHSLVIFVEYLGEVMAIGCSLFILSVPLA